MTVWCPTHHPTEDWVCLRTRCVSGEQETGIATLPVLRWGRERGSSYTLKMHRLVLPEGPSTSDWSCSLNDAAPIWAFDNSRPPRICWGKITCALVAWSAHCRNVSEDESFACVATSPGWAYAGCVLTTCALISAQDTGVCPDPRGPEGVWSPLRMRHRGEAAAQLGLSWWVLAPPLAQDLC